MDMARQRRRLSLANDERAASAPKKTAISPEKTRRYVHSNGPALRHNFKRRGWRCKIVQARRCYAQTADPPFFKAAPLATKIDL
jgi:hypothetical protein